MLPPCDTRGALSKKVFGGAVFLLLASRGACVAVTMHRWQYYSWLKIVLRLIPRTPTGAGTAPVERDIYAHR